MNEKEMDELLAGSGPGSPCETFCPVKRTPCKFWNDGCDCPVCWQEKGQKADSPSLS